MTGWHPRVLGVLKYPFTIIYQASDVVVEGEMEVMVEEGEMEVMVEEEMLATGVGKKQQKMRDQQNRNFPNTQYYQ